MRTIICPVDGLPCDPNCSDRYKDLPEGGCILSDCAAIGLYVIAVPVSREEASRGE